MTLTNSLSTFEDTNSQANLEKELESAKLDLTTICIDKYYIHIADCPGLTGIKHGITSIVSGGFFNPESQIGIAGTSSVVLATGHSWVKELKENQLIF